MKNSDLPPEKLVDYYDLARGESPYPFLVITLAALGSAWEAHVREVKDDHELKELVKRDSHPSVVFAALRSLYPVRFGSHYMYVPVKSKFFEVVVPFDS